LPIFIEAVRFIISKNWYLRCTFEYVFLFKVLGIKFIFKECE